MHQTRPAETFTTRGATLERPEQPYLRAALAALLAAAVVVALALLRKHTTGNWGFADRAPSLSLQALGRSSLALLLAGLFILPFLRRPAAAAAAAMRPGQMALGWVSLVLAALFLAVFLANPALFSALAREDRSVEWGSALALFLGCGLLLASAVLLLRQKVAPGFSARLCALGALLLAAALFVVGMEEISWMQRVFDIETPALLIEGNMQKELNFHNLSTNASELLYYGGSFAFLVLLPFLKEVAPLPAVLRTFAPLIPGRVVLAVSAPIASFNYDMWHLLPIQMVLILGVAVCIHAAMTARGRGEAALFAAGALLLALSQGLFITFGDQLVRLWDPTEYKELFIGLGFACYGGQVLYRAMKGAVLVPRRLQA